MRKILALGFLFLSLQAMAQLEAGLFLGGTQYQGDLSHTPFVAKAVRPVGGIFLRKQFSPRLAVRAGMNLGRIMGSDKLATDPGKRIRNLDFYSNIFEVSAVGEFHLRQFILNYQAYRFSPYVFGGIALFMFKPRTIYQGEIYDLQPIYTEANKPAYSLTNVSFPLGVGLKYNFYRLWTLGVEVGYRKTFTDYIDDVGPGNYSNYLYVLRSQGIAAAALTDRSREFEDPALQTQKSETLARGNPKTKDNYIFFGITISRTFQRMSCTAF